MVRKPINNERITPLLPEHWRIHIGNSAAVCFRWQRFHFMTFRLFHKLSPEVIFMSKDKKKEFLPSLALWSNAIAAAPAPIVTDPNGSYTGRARDPYEKPIQDADDL